MPSWDCLCHEVDMNEQLKCGPCVPCFPSKQSKVVEPQQTVPDAVKYKNIQRYGETQINYVNRPLRPDQWKKSQRSQNPNAGRPLPETPREVPEPKRLTARPPISHRTPRSEMESVKAPSSSVASSRRTQGLTADFFISVPIFNETFDHSYRKKNEYVYRDTTDDEASVYHQSISRGSSLRDLRQEVMYHTPPTGKGRHVEKRRERRRPRSLQRLPENRRRRPQSGSEASYNTHSTTYSYESERFEEPYKMRRSRSTSGLMVESDDEDYR